MAMFLEQSKKNCPDRSLTYKYLSFGEKIVKISPVDPEIIVLERPLKNKKINASKVYSPVGKFIKQAKYYCFHVVSHKNEQK